MTDEELIERLLEDTNTCPAYVAAAAADRIEALVKDKERLEAALQEIATDEHPLGWIAIAALTTEKPHDRA